MSNRRERRAKHVAREANASFLKQHDQFELLWIVRCGFSGHRGVIDNNIYQMLWHVWKLLGNTTAANDWIEKHFTKDRFSDVANAAVALWNIPGNWDRLLRFSEYVQQAFCQRS